MPKKCLGQRKKKEQQEKRPATPTFPLKTWDERQEISP
ncbi:hypothetical protein Krac_11371 [Ktedonobacter racemifer DSM 44963]|uniref:Uncharacterized protein n=1 Tax=Ktedonobacter racemifer DSM 44963 TaxID=485913 RepID=D6TK42_KTERA|nr:hypothetical protein Krac_11371 [Ktedonobacter racemifer DSM 44963]